MTNESNQESDIQLQEDQTEAETETDLLFKQLDAIKKQSRALRIIIGGAADNLNCSKLSSKHPVLSLNIPNSLFLLWSKRNKIENTLGIAETSLIYLAAENLENLIRLDTASTTLIQRLRIKQSRFMATHKRSSGSKRSKLQAQSTNMIMLQHEIIAFNTSTVNTQATTTLSGSISDPNITTNRTHEASETIATTRSAGTDIAKTTAAATTTTNVTVTQISGTSSNQSSNTTTTATSTTTANTITSTTTATTTNTTTSTTTTTTANINTSTTNSTTSATITSTTQSSRSPSKFTRDQDTQCLQIKYGKNYNDLSDRHQRERRKQIRDHVTSQLQQLSKIGLQPVSLKLQSNSKEEVSINLSDENLKSRSEEIED